MQSWNLWFLGRDEEAVALAGTAVTQAREAGRAHALCFTLSFASAVHWCVDDAPGALGFARDACSLGQRFGFPLWTGLNTLFALWAQVRLGDATARKQGLHAAEQMRQAYRAGSTISRWILGAAMFEAHEYGEAEKQLRQALADAHAGLDQFCEPELLRLLAQCSLKNDGDPLQASALLDEAMRIAQGMQSLGPLRRVQADLLALGQPASVAAPPR